LRAKRATVKLAGDLYKVAKWLGGAQDGDVSRDLRLEARAYQARACLGRGQLLDVFQIIEKRQVHRAGFIERSEPLDLLATAGGIDQMRLRQRGDFSQRRRRWLF
jgi:hypothetical protein